MSEDKGLLPCPSHPITPNAHGILNRELIYLTTWENESTRCRAGRALDVPRLFSTPRVRRVHGGVHTRSRSCWARKQPLYARFLDRFFSICWTPEGSRTTFDPSHRALLENSEHNSLMSQSLKLGFDVILRQALKTSMLLSFFVVLGKLDDP